MVSQEWLSGQPQTWAADAFVLFDAGTHRVNAVTADEPTLTRLNATKHGLLATGITELDDADGHRTLLDNLKKKKKPVGVVEMFLVESAAMDMLRWPRARRFEAEFITGELHPSTLAGNPLGDLDFFQPTVVDPGLPAAIGSKSAQPLVSVFQRYESTFAYRCACTPGGSGDARPWAQVYELLLTGGTHDYERRIHKDERTRHGFHGGATRAVIIMLTRANCIARISHSDLDSVTPRLCKIRCPNQVKPAFTIR